MLFTGMDPLCYGICRSHDKGAHGANHCKDTSAIKCVAENDGACSDDDYADDDCHRLNSELCGGEFTFFVKFVALVAKFDVVGVISFAELHCCVSLVVGLSRWPQRTRINQLIQRKKRRK